MIIDAAIAGVPRPLPHQFSVFADPAGFGVCDPGSLTETACTAFHRGTPDARQISYGIGGCDRAGKALIAEIRGQVSGATKKVHEPQRNGTGSGVTRRQFHMMTCFWKPRANAKFATVPDEKNTIPHLRHTVKGAVEKAVPRVITQRIKCLDHLLHNIVAAIMQNVRDVLHQQCERPCAPHIFKITQVKVSTRVDFECFRMFRDFAEFCSADTRIGLAGRPTHQHIHCMVRRTELQLFA